MESECLALRRLYVVSSEGRREVQVHLHFPEQQESGSWTCRVVSTGTGPSQPGLAFGVDGMQAVKIAILNAEAWLQTLPECKAGELLHDDGEVYR